MIVGKDIALSSVLVLAAFCGLYLVFLIFDAVMKRPSLTYRVRARNNKKARARSRAKSQMNMHSARRRIEVSQLRSAIHTDAVRLRRELEREFDDHGGSSNV
jgi:hypothetical protein